MNFTIRLDVTKIKKEHLFEGRNGAKYLNLVVWENRDGPDQFGNTHRVDQSILKEAREAGDKGPILGNLKPMQTGGGNGGQRQQPQGRQDYQQRPQQVRQQNYPPPRQPGQPLTPAYREAPPDMNDEIPF